MSAQTIPERIRQRRQQMLVHSYLYYQLDTPIVTDDTWQRWADELADLQRQHPAPIHFFDKAFADWTGETGMHLPRESWTREMAHHVLRLHESSSVPMQASIAPPAPAAQAPAPSAPAIADQFALF